MAVAVGNVFSFSLNQILFGQQVVNTFALRVVTVGTITDEVTFINTLWGTDDDLLNIADGLRDRIRQQQSNSIRHSHWLVQRVMPTPTAQFLVPILTNLDGNLVGACDTANVAMSISRKGLAPGKRNRGRIAVAAVPIADQDSGRFVAGALTRGGATAAEMIGVKNFGAAIGTAEMGWWNPGFDFTDDAGFHHIQTPLFVAAKFSQAKSTIRVQRSRTIGVGR